MDKIIRPDNDENVLSPAQRECIQLLRDTLASAENGDITSLVVVACGVADFGCAMAGSDAPKMNLGLDVAKRTILERASPTQPKSVLRRVR